MAKKSLLTKNKKVIAAVGVGVAAAATAVGAYLFSGKRGVKNRKKVAVWATKAKTEVLRGLKRMKDVDWRTYSGEINRVLERYRRLEGVTAAEIAGLGRELKGYWKHISKNTARQGTAATNAARRIAPRVRRKRKR